MRKIFTLIAVVLLVTLPVLAVATTTTKPDASSQPASSPATKTAVNSTAR